MMDTCEIECILLSELMQHGHAAEDILNRVSADDFTTDARRDFFLELCRMYGNGDKVNQVTAYAMVQANPNLFDVVRPYGSFSNLYSASIDSSLIDSYIDLTKKGTEMRRLVSIARRVIAKIESGEETENVREELENALYSTDNDSSGRNVMTPAELAVECIKTMEERADVEKRKKLIINSPFTRLNTMIGGLERGDLVILSAPSGAGKSAMAMNLAGIHNGTKVIYINSEMSESQMELRIAAHVAKIPHHLLRAGKVTEAELDRAKKIVFETVSESGFYLTTIPDMQTFRVVTEIRRAINKYGIELAIVDYIGRADYTQRKDIQRWEILSQASQMLKTVAQREKICVLMVAQLASAGDKLAGSSYMAHDADLWLNLEKYSGKDDEEYPWNYWVLVNKARNTIGDGRCKMYFSGDYLTFTDNIETARKWRKEEDEKRIVSKSKRVTLLDIPP